MESDSDSEFKLIAKLEALKTIQAPTDQIAKPQLSPTASTVDRALHDAEIRERLKALGIGSDRADSESEMDEAELEDLLQDGGGWYEDLNDAATRSQFDEVRHLINQLSDSRPGSRSRARPPLRQESTRTIVSVPNQYSVDSDADDEGAAEELVRSTRDALSLEGNSNSTSSQSSRDVSVDAARYVRNQAVVDDDDGDDTDEAGSYKGRSKARQDSQDSAQRTPPSHARKLSADTEVGRYEALFSSLETPRAPPMLSPTDEEEPLPSAFTKLQLMNAHTGKIEDRGQEEKDREPDLGPAPRLDLEGWRAAKDDKPETWCGICNADAEYYYPTCLISSKKDLRWGFMYGRSAKDLVSLEVPLQASTIIAELGTAFDGLSEREKKAEIQKSKAIFEILLKNKDGKEQSWVIDLKNNGNVTKGKPSGKVDVTLIMNDTFCELASGKIAGQKAYMTGRLKTRGNMMLATKLEPILKLRQNRVKAKL
ncbi:hypothetical protein FRB99_006004 [Tulasnella sp. 403]|nr:hypothetical protein FRB99_006004 [Tulasnella sp. 403]